MDAIVTFGREGAIRSANPAAREIFGYGAEELIGLGVDRLAPEALPVRQGVPFLPNSAAADRPGSLACAAWPGAAARTAESFRSN